VTQCTPREALPLAVGELQQLAPRELPRTLVRGPRRSAGRGCVAERGRDHALRERRGRRGIARGRELEQLTIVEAAAERGEDFIYVCYDNEAYMNTGVQRSSSTPYGTRTMTTPGGGWKRQQKKNIVEVLAALIERGLLGRRPTAGRRRS